MLEITRRLTSLRQGYFDGRTGSFEQDRYYFGLRRCILELSKTPLHPLPDTLIRVHDSLLVYDNIRGISSGFADSRGNGHRICFDNYAKGWRQARQSWAEITGRTPHQSSRLSIVGQDLGSRAPISFRTGSSAT